MGLNVVKLLKPETPDAETTAQKWKVLELMHKENAVSTIISNPRVGEKSNLRTLHTVKLF